MVYISKPCFLTKLPYPVNSESTKKCYITKVFPKGCQEIIVAINEIGINIYNANSGQIITNYPVDRNTIFSCTPASIYIEANRKRMTVAGTIETLSKIPKLLLWIEKSNLEVQIKFVNTKSKITNIQLFREYIIIFLESGEIIQYNSSLNVVYEAVTNIPNVVECGQIKNLRSNEDPLKESKEKDILYKVSIENFRIIIIDIFQIQQITCTKLNTVSGTLVMDFNMNHKITLAEQNIIYHLTPTHLFTYVLTLSNIELKSKTEFAKKLSIPIFLEIIHDHHIIICSATRILLFDTVHQVFFFSREIEFIINTAPVIIHTSESSKNQNALLILSSSESLILSTISSSKKSLLIDMFGKADNEKEIECMIINSIMDFEKKKINKLALESPKKTKKKLNIQKKIVRAFLTELKEYSLLKNGNKFDNLFFKYFDTKKITNNFNIKNSSKNSNYNIFSQDRKIHMSPQVLDEIIKMIFLSFKKDTSNSNKTRKSKALFYPKRTFTYLVKTAPLSLINVEYSGLVNTIMNVDSSLLNLLLSSDLLPPKELASALKYVLNTDPVDLKIFKRILRMMDNYIGEQVVFALKTELSRNDLEKLINLLGKQILLKKKSKKFKETSYISDELIIYGMLENSLDTIGICGITIENISPLFFNFIHNALKKTINEMINLNNIVTMLNELIRRAGGHKNINQTYQEFKSNKQYQNRITENIKMNSNSQLRNTILLNQLSLTSTLQETHFKTKRAENYQKGFSIGKYSIERLEL
ncbi:hypothetical protein PORY_001911 [Pneumocystis oryctolagi]|uniref:Uncharacterized protein n=1 Tax=Pneumocystis oryctolagi TaxID=42067 RepID=A0ACB7CBB8_9ASCO|nr:hypothetical protein PORY_001911 [Pneumocystis oryctolagi]